VHSQDPFQCRLLVTLAGQSCWLWGLCQHRITGGGVLLHDGSSQPHKQLVGRLMRGFLLRVLRGVVPSALATPTLLFQVCQCSNYCKHQCIGVSQAIVNTTVSVLALDLWASVAAWNSCR
jgi:hypothetical protein